MTDLSRSNRVLERLTIPPVTQLPVLDLAKLGSAASLALGDFSTIDPHTVHDLNLEVLLRISF